ncbi:OmpA family protein [Devosia sp. RR2S18]|uniref:OmpA family protein n=1 Tax=Devosia rhizosphaerae TaxID=3049774 RepID=UPI002540034E|nr:OmpA family protein [Devosia sp. RR2S18]WIJ24118.1 OmpA family protein [Devosia sp. RR2S18]
MKPSAGSKRGLTIATVMGGINLALLMQSPAFGQATDTTPPAELTHSSSFVTFEALRVEDYWMSATRQPAGVIVFDGYAPSEAIRRAFAEREGADIHWLQLGSGEPAVYQSATTFGLGVLDYLSEGRFALRENVISITGMARSPADHQALQELLDAGVPPGVVLVRAEISLPKEAAAAVESGLLPAAESVAAELVQVTAASEIPLSNSGECRSALEEFSSRNAILFRSGSAAVTPSSELALDELAADLKNCTASAVYIEGHTDAAGDDRKNLALSVARAEAVVAGLVARGIEPQRLYAVGNGETQPVADNETEAGKRLNRRIVVTIPDEEA